MERTILHSDMNHFYAAVEILYDPSLLGKPVVVAGDAEARHGIVLAKSDEAKASGVRTGEALWQARQKCPDAVFVPAHYDRYMKYSALARDLYVEYTDLVEPYGLDECWLDCTGSTHLFGDGKTIADAIRARIKSELGLTVSVGVSFNKVFAKLGSDLKKPDATTVIGLRDFREKIWSLSVSELLYVGPATTAKLARYGIATIGQLASADTGLLYWLLGKNGVMLHEFANGRDTSTVRPYYRLPPIKTVGNSTTTPRDLTTDDDVKITLLALAESVAARLREQGSLCRTVQLGVRDNELWSYERQMGMDPPSSNATDLSAAAFRLFKIHHTSRKPVRSLSLRALGLIPEDEQLSLFPEEQARRKEHDLEVVIDRLRGKYGYTILRRALALLDPALDLDAKGEHVIHPVGFLGTLNQDRLKG